MGMEIKCLMKSGRTAGVKRAVKTATMYKAVPIDKMGSEVATNKFRMFVCKLCPRFLECSINGFPRTATDLFTIIDDDGAYIIKDAIYCEEAKCFG